MSWFGFSASKKKEAQQTQQQEQEEEEEEAETGNDAAQIDGPGLGAPTSQPERLFAEGEAEEDKLVGVIVTIFDGSSYDTNFREMQPKTVPGERVSTYSMRCCDVGRLHALLAGAEPAPVAPSAWLGLLGDLRAVPPDAVTLNWECCSGCSDAGFPECGANAARRQRSLRPRSGGSRLVGGAAANPTMQLMGLAVRRGFTVMCSDFSLKALIAQWSDEHLGPNPFLKLGEECDERFQLDFQPHELQHEEVPQQLQVVGELCAEQGRAVVGAMGGTIVYTVNPHRAETELYSLKVLTVVSSWVGGSGDGVPEALQCSVGGGGHAKRGAAGHVTLTYASGGQLLTSMGHWIELSRIDTSLDLVARAVARNFGAGEFTKLDAEYRGLGTEVERQACVQRWSKEMVRKSAPSRMKARTKF